MNHYETVFILNPVLSEDQIKEAVKKFATIITEKEVNLLTKRTGD